MGIETLTAVLDLAKFLLYNIDISPRFVVFLFRFAESFFHLFLFGIHSEEFVVICLRGFNDVLDLLLVLLKFFGIHLNALAALIHRLLLEPDLLINAFYTVFLLM